MKNNEKVSPYNYSSLSQFFLSFNIYILSFVKKIYFKGLLLMNII